MAIWLCYVQSVILNEVKNLAMRARKPKRCAAKRHNKNNTSMKNAIYYTIIIISIALAAWCGYFTVMQAESISQTIILYVVAVVVCYELSLQMHECGHKLFGLFVGMDVRFKPHKFFSGALGCEISPRHSTSLKPRFIITAVGGLVVNLALLATGIVFCVLPFDIFGDTYAVAVVILRALLPTSFYIFAVNALPLEYESGKTDVLAIVQAVRGDDTWKVAEAILTVQGLVYRGIQLKDVDEDILMNVPQLPEDDSNFVILTELRYEYYKARGNAKKAEYYKKRYEELK